MIFLVILIILFAWLVLFMKSKVHLLEPFVDISSLLNNSQHFNNYIKNIHPNMYKSKIVNYKSDFRKSYIKQLRFPKINELEVLNKYSSICQEIFKVNNLTQLSIIPWYFIISNKNIEMGMPYTLGSYIIINELTLINLLRHLTINHNFINTLIHEKIHILQRINQVEFNKFYKSNYDFIGPKIHITDVPLQYRKIYMSNPDSNEDFWLYKISGVYYYPILIKNGNNVKSIGCNKSGTIDLDILKRQLKYSNHISIYHPNEIFACLVTDMILSKNIKKPYLQLFNSL